MIVEQSHYNQLVWLPAFAGGVDTTGLWLRSCMELEADYSDSQKVVGRQGVVVPD